MLEKLSNKQLKNLYRRRLQVWLAYEHDLRYWYKKNSKYGRLITLKMDRVFQQIKKINTELFDRRIFK
jgi:hypothetical protein